MGVGEVGGERAEGTNLRVRTVAGGLCLTEVGFVLIMKSTSATWTTTLFVHG